MRRIAIISLLLAMPFPAQADDYLTGDERLACEAVLCLSSGIRPSECSQSLKRYFSIRKKKWHRTLDARKSFLRLCPDARGGKMDSLIEVVANGAGQCSAAELNATNLKTITDRICRDVPDGEGGTREYCFNREREVISERLPAVCADYASHDYTFKVSAHYVGDPLNGGHWVDDAKE